MRQTDAVVQVNKHNVFSVVDEDVDIAVVVIIDWCDVERCSIRIQRKVEHNRAYRQECMGMRKKRQLAMTSKCYLQQDLHIWNG